MLLFLCVFDCLVDHLINDHLRKDLAQIIEKLNIKKLQTS